MKKVLQKICRIVLIVLLCLGIVLGAGFFLINKNLTPQLKSMAEARVRAYAAVVFTNSLARLVADPGLYTELVEIFKDETGRVTYLTTNVLKMNAISNTLAKDMQKTFQGAEKQDLSLNLGAAMGSDIFAGWGPEIDIKTEPVGAVSVKYISEFASAGINQTRHRIYITVKSDLRIILPLSSAAVQVEERLLLAESIIVGITPQTFINVTSVEDALNLIP